MNSRIITMTAVTGLIVALTAGELLAAGRGNGGGNDKRNSTCASQQSAGGSTASTRPAGSQRRDGTFQTTGVTANGATARPENGNGLHDGSRLNTSVATTPATTP